MNEGRAVEETREAFRAELVRRYGVPWYETREALIYRLSVAMVVHTPSQADREALVAKWCAEGLPALERWLAETERLNQPCPPAATPSGCQSRAVR